FDPLIPYLKINGLDLKSIALTKKCLAGFACVAIAADHSGIDYRRILHNSRFIFDARNVYQGEKNKKVVRL
ncbi:MAG: UDP-N-acetyl-D-glucosamine dehydrogenase, partial [Candidatus Omnitrophota bacterium]